MVGRSLRGRWGLAVAIGIAPLACFSEPESTGDSTGEVAPAECEAIELPRDTPSAPTSAMAAAWRVSA